MGIEKFFSALSKNKLIPPVIFPFSKKLNTRYLVIDFNSIVYNISKPLLDEINKVLYLQIVAHNEDIKNIIKQVKKTYDDIDNLIINKIIAYILKMLDKYINSDRLEYIYIGVDGVPSKAKMMEQKRRNYMAFIINNAHDIILNKYVDALDETRKTYLLNKFSWNTGKIKPGTDFMIKLEEKLIANNFLLDIKKICKNVKEYIFSSANICGEAEKKIVNYLKNLPIKERLMPENIVFYSPDADVMILSMLLNNDIGTENRLTGIRILRYNPQTGKYDYFDVDLACKYLFEYMNNKLNSIPITITNIIIDICLLFTLLFGNDFIPKIASYDAIFSFEYIIDKYCELLSDYYKKNKTIKYILNNDSKVKINYDVFLNMIKILQYNETQKLQMLYLYRKYRNIDKLISLFESSKETFISDTNEYFKLLNQICYNIRNNKQILPLESNLANLIKKTLDLNLNSDEDVNIIEKLKQYYNSNNKFPLLNIKFKSFERSINDQYHRQNLEKSLDKISKDMKITKYDEETYKFDYMLDEYIKILNAQVSDVGKITLNNRDYIWKTNKSQEIQLAYYKYIGILNININNKEMYNLLYSFLEGLIWIIEYYYNYNNDEFAQGNIWYYKYKHAPLLTQLHLLLQQHDQSFLDNIVNNLSKYKVPLKQYFTPIQQLLYVMIPYNYEEILPKEYHKFYNPKYYPLTTLRNINEVNITCINAYFLTKCHVPTIELTITDEEFLKNTKEINSDYHKTKYNIYIYKYI